MLTITSEQYGLNKDEVLQTPNFEVRIMTDGVCADALSGAIDRWSTFDPECLPLPVNFASGYSAIAFSFPASLKTLAEAESLQRSYVTAQIRHNAEDGSTILTTDYEGQGFLIGPPSGWVSSEGRLQMRFVCVSPPPKLTIASIA